MTGPFRNPIQTVKAMLKGTLVTKNWKKNSPTGSGNIGVRSRKYRKSHSRLDPTLRMPEVVHALNRVPTRAKLSAFYPDVFSVKKRYFSVPSFYGLQER